MYQLSAALPARDTAASCEYRSCMLIPQRMPLYLAVFLAAQKEWRTVDNLKNASNNPYRVWTCRYARA